MAKAYEKKYEWLHFSQSYLFLARLGCQEILGEKYEQYPKFFSESRILHFFVPILFDIKHGIEIFIKTLKIVLADELNRDEKAHNVSELFLILKKQISKHKIAELIKRKHSENSEDIILKIANKNIDKLSIIIDDLERLIYKYYRCEIIKEKINDDFIIEDINNCAFRYPENNLKIIINYDKVLLKIDKKDIEQILKDIDELLKNLNSLGFILDVYKKHRN